jgi:hypothetical protein
MAYAWWAEFTSIGYLVMRFMEWASPCDAAPFALEAWNSFVSPLLVRAGRGYAGRAILALDGCRCNVML